MSQTISVIAPISRAIDTAKQLLFVPFAPLKWLGLGFVVWLAMLGGNVNTTSGNLFVKLAALPCQAALEWTMAHGALLILLAVFAGVFLLVVSLAVSWVSSRAKFIFMENVVRDRADIIEPWQRHRAQGNSYFLFSVAFALAALAMLGVIMLIGALVAMPDITRHHFGANAMAAIVLGGLLFGFYAITLHSLLIFLEDFIVPLMFLRSCRALVAWSEFFKLFKAHTGSFILYLLFRIMLGWALGAISLVVFCCLCCVMWIPYVSTVMFLPLFVFLRCYSLHFLEQFGGEYRVFLSGSVDYLAVVREVPSSE